MLPAPPDTFGFFLARTYAAAGWQVRRKPWRLVGAVTSGVSASGQTVAPGDLPLKWINFPGMIFDATLAAGSAIVVNTDITLADARALDWTCLSPDGMTTGGSDAWIAPNTALFASAPKSGGITGGGAPSPGSGGGGGGGTLGGDGSGDGGGGSSGGGGGVPVPTLTLTVARTSSHGTNDCIPQLSDGGGGWIEDTTPVTDNYSATIALSGGDPTKIYFWQIRLGGTVLGSGTLGGTSSQAITFSLTNVPGWFTNLEALAHLPFQPDLLALADISNVAACAVSGGGGDPPTYGCTDPGASNYDSAATADNGSCVYCPAGYHWDSGTSACVPD